MSVIEKSSDGGIDDFNNKVTYVAARVVHEHSTAAQQPRMSSLEAAGIVLLSTDRGQGVLLVHGQDEKRHRHIHGG